MLILFYITVNIVVYIKSETYFKEKYFFYVIHKLLSYGKSIFHI